MPKPEPRVIDDPQPGWFIVKLVKGGPRVPARIYRDGGLNAEILGVVAGIDAVWLWGEFITEERYQYLMSLRDWALVHDPEHPLCHPRRPIDVSTLPPAF
jgi:hypothetical protein